MHPPVLEQVSFLSIDSRNIQTCAGIGSTSRASSHLLHNAPLARCAALEGGASRQADIGAFGAAFSTRSIAAAGRARSRTGTGICACC